MKKQECINASERKKIDELYCLYEFEKDYENDCCSVYIYEQGYFNNAEIVVFNNKFSEVIEVVKDDYIRTGYAVSVREEKEYDTIERLLFNGFFKTKSSNNRVESEYSQFCDMQTKRLGGIKYSYIESEYTINGLMMHDHILDKICEFFNQEGAQLIILEAPAGFGKTCTSYEVANMLAKQADQRIPILAELSKNRTAKIFNYVLLTEIDRKFTKLSSKLVTKQIVDGNLPLIIDGFDELLSKTAIDNDDDVEDAKSMLDTIANLLSEGSKAKILLTSRKSSIFVGEVFENWLVKKLEHCAVNRIQILAPTAGEWIGHDRLSVLDSANVCTDLIANPVLLTMLRSTPISEFKNKFQTASDVLETYLSLMLQREKERQQLLLSAEEQRDIMRELAAMMVLLDISSDEAEGIKALIEEIVADNIEKYIAQYSDYNNFEDYMVPTEDEFVMKLVHNALLDRINMGSNCVGFINEFIFGILIGEAIVEGQLKIEEVTTKYFDLAVTSFAAEKEVYKEKLFEIISKSKKVLSTEQKMAVELNLLGKLEYDFVDEYIADTVFVSQMNMQTQHYFYNCIFNACTFNKNTIELDLFEGCQFINCNFYDLKIEKKTCISIEEESTFTSCIGHEELLMEMKKCLKGTNDKERDQKDEKYYQRLVLEQYWMPGSERADLRKSIHTLYKGIKPKERQHVMKAIDSLISKGILKKLNYCIELNTAQMTVVKSILGR